MRGVTLPPLPRNPSECVTARLRIIRVTASCVSVLIFVAAFPTCAGVAEAARVKAPWQGLARVSLLFLSLRQALCVCVLVPAPFPRFTRCVCALRCHRGRSVAWCDLKFGGVAERRGVTRRHCDPLSLSDRERTRDGPSGRKLAVRSWLHDGHDDAQSTAHHCCATAATATRAQLAHAKLAHAKQSDRRPCAVSGPLMVGSLMVHFTHPLRSHPLVPTLIATAQPTMSASPAVATPSPSRRRRVIIDTDGGCDDAIAILMALRDENTEVVAMTSVFGNVKQEQATGEWKHTDRWRRHACRIIAALPQPLIFSLCAPSSNCREHLHDPARV